MRKQLEGNDSKARQSQRGNFMPTAIAILSATLCFLCTTVAFAGENLLLGTWKLKSFMREVAATGERYNEREPD
jgi:hypothetical protein